MLYPLIGPRLHGWLDDIVVVVYLVGAWLLGLGGGALAIALGGAGVHFVLTRLTNYPQERFKFGTLKGSRAPRDELRRAEPVSARRALKLIPFRVHAFIELGEGLAVLAATFSIGAQLPLPQRAFLLGMGASQLSAFAFSDYGPWEGKGGGPHPRPSQTLPR